MDRVLIVDDDVELCRLLAERLSTEGFSLEAAHDGPRGLSRALSQEHALVILDLLRNLRSQSSMPVLMLTARGEDVDRILGLELGADDYLPKPFNPRELIARARAILRRSERVSDTSDVLIVDDVRLDPAAREVLIDGIPLDITSVEFSLLEALLRNAGHVVTREHLTQTVLGHKLGTFDRVIDVHVSNLRKKLSRVHAGERIKAIRGSGYQFVARSEAK
jgi:DNA-binding response OmpR family regulator